jgi:Calcineurin-like phosphoesterase/Iron/zinc purple acid phosphatase-like protein C
MKLNRRKFLFLSGFAGLGILGALKGLSRWAIAPSSTPNPAMPSPVASSPIPIVASNIQPLLRFVATADTGSGDDNQYAVAEAMERYRQANPFLLALLGGDNIYTNGEMWKIGAVFEQPYKALLQAGVKFRACLGNHDIRSDNGDSQVKYAAFNMAQRYYTFQEKNVQFFVLDTNVNANWDAQLPWLEKELRRSTADWKIVYGHHPIYSSGVYGTNQTFVKLFAPLFQKYGVQVYLNGHEHSYERSNPIAGTTYLIVGNGGAALRDVGRSEWTAHAESRYGFTALEVYADRLEVKAIATDHTIFDKGIIPLKTA